MELTWRTKTGEEIPIAKMTTTHIENCIALMERTGNDWGLFCTYDEDGMPWADQGRNPVYDALVFELQKRIVMGAKKMAEEPETFRFEMLNAVSTDINDEDYGDYPGCDLMTVAEFLETVEWGGFIPDDGSAIIRGGTKDKEYWDWLTPIPSDATHIEWYNK